MIGFIKFGLAKSGAMFPICEVLFFLDILVLIIFKEKTSIWTWYRDVRLVQYYNVDRILWRKKNTIN